MIFNSVCRKARAISSMSLRNPLPKSEWQRTLAERRRRWLNMLGLWPLPARTPLKAVITGTLDRGDYVVEKIHFQSVPDAYVPGNLYRPARIERPLPAVLYLCGHSKSGKIAPAYQAHPRWFAQHGYLALALDPIQVGESQGFHHGTYLKNRWDWPSRGYTPAGVEVWNAMRALDYLQTRREVDSRRLGVTGLSGGGAMSWFLGAADERVICVAPVCQTGSIEQLVVDRILDSHCDCAVWINYDQWCTPDLGALIAPRALLVASGTEDPLWRPYAFREVVHRIRRQYAALGVPDKAALAEDISPHGYTPKLNRAIFTWFNRHLKQAPELVADDVTDFVEPEKDLLVFGGRPPKKDVMRQIDLRLPRLAAPPQIRTLRDWQRHRRAALAQLRRLTFRHLPEHYDTPPDEYRADGSLAAGRLIDRYLFHSDDGVPLQARIVRWSNLRRPPPLVAYALPPESRTGSAAPGLGGGIDLAGIHVRNTGATSVGPGLLWTLRRVYPLFGQTLPERQVHDLLAGLALVRRQLPGGRLAVYGEGYTAVLAIYAAILEPRIAEIILANPPGSHRNPATPELPGILKIGDLPQNLALVFPRPITFIGKMPAAYRWTARLYARLGQAARIRVAPDSRAWRPGNKNWQNGRW